MWSLTFSWASQFKNISSFKLFLTASKQNKRQCTCENEELLRQWSPLGPKKIIFEFDVLLQKQTCFSRWFTSNAGSDLTSCSWALRSASASWDAASSFCRLDAVLSNSTLSMISVHGNHFMTCNHPQNSLLSGWATLRISSITTIRKTYFWGPCHRAEWLAWGSH